MPLLFLVPSFVSSLVGSISHGCRLTFPPCPYSIFLSLLSLFLFRSYFSLRFPIPSCVSGSSFVIGFPLLVSVLLQSDMVYFRALAGFRMDVASTFLCTLRYFPCIFRSALPLSFLAFRFFFLFLPHFVWCRPLCVRCVLPLSFLLSVFLAIRVFFLAVPFFLSVRWCEGRLRIAQRVHFHS